MRRGLLLAFTVAACALGCKEEFILPDTQADTSVLVVEGDIVVGGGAENLFRLTRLRNLSQTEESPVTGARIDIVSSNGGTLRLTERGPGTYASTTPLSANQSYLLRIVAGANTYETHAQSPVITPPVDSVTWRQEDASVRIFAHTADPANKTRFYRWKYIETWENRAWYETYFDFVNGSIVPRPPGDQIYSCWKSEETDVILIGNSRSLDRDIISYQPIQAVERPSEKMFTRYSILVRQMGVTQEAYDFWEILRKNTELTGTLFDPQPSNLPTNLRCVNDPKAKVVGYVSVGSVTEKRLFILHSALTGWPFRDESQSCTAIESSRAQAEAFLKNNPSYLPAYFITAGGGFGVAPKTCVDCRLAGGTNVKPSFW